MTKIVGVQYKGMVNSTISWNVFFLFLFLYRSAFSVLGELVIMRFTSIGDTESYQQAGVNARLEKVVSRDPIGSLTAIDSFEASTYITDWVGAQFNILFGGNPILINVGFQSITYIGLVYLLLSLPQKARLGMALMIMLPSFSLWTSIASKESIVAFCVAVLSGFLVRQYTRSSKLNMVHLFSILLLYVFKPHYLVPFAFAWSAKNLGNIVKQKALLAYLGLLISLAGLFLFREEIDALAFHVQWTFEVVADVRSTRLESFFVEKYDVFYKMFEGFYLSFMGPTLAEALDSPLHLVTYVESLVLLSVLLLALLKRLYEIPIYSFVVGFGVSFWVLFPNYPLGVMNPGSAIRYRSGWIILLFVAIIILMSKDLFVLWRKNESASKAYEKP
jgi:hypothetical protein